MMDLSLKRIVSYLIDVVIVSVVVSLFMFLPVDPYSKKYKDTYENYQDYVEKYSEGSSDNEILKEYTYNLAKYRTYSSLYTAGALILYFGIGAYVLKGQTLGKKLMKIRVVSNSDKKLTIWNYIIRIVILNNIMFTLINIGGVYVLNVNNYYYLSYVVSMFTSLITLLILMMIMFRNDGRGLHDYLAGTKVIEDIKVKVVKKETIKEKYEKKVKKEKNK